MSLRADDHDPPLRQAVYERLVAVARAGGTTTYREVAALAGLDMSREEDRRRLAQLLRAISTAEHRRGRPLLSAVVVHRARHRPGAGFFDLARELGLLQDARDREARERFFRAELARVHATWARPIQG